MTKLAAVINVDCADIQAYIDKRIEEFKDSSLTREQAILRIRDIRRGIETRHLNGDNLTSSALMAYGAELELMAIFDIKEGEL